MKIEFTARSWGHLISWTTLAQRTADQAMLLSIYRLIEDIRRSSFTGLGKPEPLRGQLSGYWSRRISQEHRLIYRIAGRPDDGQRIEIISCRGHY